MKSSRTDGKMARKNCANQPQPLYVFYHTYQKKDDEDKNRGLGTIRQTLARRM
jgi:hypothetical protein